MQERPPPGHRGTCAATALQIPPQQRGVIDCHLPMRPRPSPDRSRLFCNFFGFNLWVNGWTQVVILIPFFLCGPRLFDPSSPIQMGLLVQVSDAFQQTFSSLAVGMDRWASVNDFRSVVRRLTEWEAHLNLHAELGHSHAARSAAAPTKDGSGKGQPSLL